jgi:hypothetical protein
MIHPQTVSCDFCSNPIAPGDHIVRIELPIPPTLRKELRAYLDGVMTAHPVSSPLSVMFGPEALVPQTWSLECCTACAFAILPDVREKVAGQIREMLARKIAASRRHDEAAQELDEEAV